MELSKIQENCVIRIVDDDEGLRCNIDLRLSYAGWNVKTYGSAKSFFTDDQPSRPGCVVLDYLMPGMTGLALQQEMNRRDYQLPVIFLTGHADVDVAIESFKGGAVDFLKKPVNEENLLAAIAKAAEASLMERLGIPDEKSLRITIRSMPDRERDVLKLMLQGLTPKGIAERLSITDHTVYEYRTSIYKKLGTKAIGDLPLDWFKDS